MYLVGENHQEAPFVKLIVSTLTGNTTHAVKRRLNALISLLNLCSEPSSKVEVWTGACGPFFLVLCIQHQLLRYFSSIPSSFSCVYVFFFVCFLFPVSADGRTISISVC